MPEKTKNLFGIISVCLLTIIVFCICFGNLPGRLNHVSFAGGGDGVQSYINMEYHILYDSTYLRCNSMNYPYGEHVFFTNNQPLISNSIRFISRNLVDISGYTLGILNFLMLFSLFITPLIIYFILRHFKTGYILSVTASVAIAFLTPQMDRFGGHYNLSYVCVIPLIILLLIKFFSKPSLLLSVLIFITMMAGALTHFYLYGFFALLIIFFYTDEFFHRKTFGNNRLAAFHLFFQLILPFLILQFFYLSDHVTDRPGYPWGFLLYRAYPQSVFLPLNKPYGQFFHSIINISHIDWEGYAFVGTIATLGFIFFLFRFAQKIYKKEFTSIWQVTNNRMLNIMFWASLAGLLYSFGLPFILGLQWLIDLIGPLRQMRGIARFAWVFYYVINIVTIYWLWTWWQSERKKISIVIISLAVIILCLDAWYNARNRGQSLNNPMPVLTDRALMLPENQWIRRIPIKNYQAFIPLPYFHVGSENVWIDGGCEIVNQSFAAIKNSGLPCMGVMLSRTSLNQTFENLSLIIGPTCDHPNTQRFPSEKPFLLMVAKCELNNWHEKELIRHAKLIDSSGTFNIYHLPFNALMEIQDSLNKTVHNEYTGRKLYQYEACSSSDSVKNFIYLNYEESLNNAMFGKGCLTGKAKQEPLLYSGRVRDRDTAKTFVISLWMNSIRTDLYARTNIIVIETDSAGNSLNQTNYPIFKHIVQISGNKALIEFKFRMPDLSRNIIIKANNPAIGNKEIEVDNLLIRHELTDIYLSDTRYLWKNNYYYCK